MILRSHKGQNVEIGKGERNGEIFSEELKKAK
jgi:hypothetical protein